MKITFVISKDKVLEEVAKSTAYVGVAVDAHEKIATVDANEEILGSFIEVACNDLLLAFGAYAPKVEGLQFELSMPDGFDTDKATILERLVFEYIVSVVIWKWLFLYLPEKAVMWEQRAEDVKTRIKSTLNSRSKVLRRVMRPF